MTSKLKVRNLRKGRSARVRGALLGAAGAIVVLQGCSSVAVHSAPGSAPPPYAGTQRAVKETKRAWSNYRYYGEVMFVLWDIPLSAVADTVMLPVDLSRRAAREDASGATTTGNADTAY